MQFIDVLNKVQNILDGITASAIPQGTANNNYQLVVLDTNEKRLETIVKSLKAHININSDISYFVSENNIPARFELDEVGKLYLSVVAEVSNYDMLNKFIESLYKSIESKQKITKLPIESIINIDVHCIFDAETSDYTKNAEKLAPVFKKFTEKTECIVHIMNTMIRFDEVQQNILAEQIFFIHMSGTADTEFYKNFNDTILYTENSYPWVSLYFMETFTPEIIIFKWLRQYLDTAVNSQIKDVCLTIREAHNNIKNEFIARIGDKENNITYSSFDELNECFEKWTAYVPVPIEQQEWNRNSDYTDVVHKNQSGKEQKKPLFSIFKPKKKKNDQPETTEIEKRFIGTPVNHDYESLKNIVVDYIKEKVSVYDMCCIIFSQLSSVSGSAYDNDYIDIYNEIIKVIESIFDISDDKFRIWQTVKEYYIENITKDKIKDYYIKVVSIIQNTVIKKINNQITDWSYLTLTVTEELDFTCDTKLKLSDNSENIFIQLVEMLENLQKNYDFIAALNISIKSIERANGIKQHRAHLLIDKYIDGSDQSYPCGSRIKQRVIHYLLQTDLSNMIKG